MRCNYTEGPFQKICNFFLLLFGFKKRNILFCIKKGFEPTDLYNLKFYFNMNARFLQIADLFYKVPASLKLTNNYMPFVTMIQDENQVISSTVKIGRIITNEKRLCHQGLVLDDTKKLSIYQTYGTENGYYITLKASGSEISYECYATEKWDKVTISENCLSPDCPPSIIDIFMMLVFIYSAAHYNTILLHASCIKYHEDGVAFIGQSGAGKSTHSRLWLKYIPDTKLLNDDQPAVRIKEDGKVSIYGTPWSGKTTCYLFDDAHLKGIIRMKQAPENKITQLNPISLFAELLSSCSMMKEDPRTFKLITATLSKLAANVPGYILENRPEEEAVKMVYNQINKNNN